MKELVLFLAVGTALLGQGPGLPPTAPTVPRFTMKVGSSYRIGAPPFSFGSSTCDERGSVFFDIAGLYSVNGILRVKGDGGEPTVIKFPESGGRGEWHVFVDSSGTVYLVLSNKTGHTLIHLSPSGEEMGRTDLSLPKTFDVDSFAVQPDGKSVFLGSTMKVNAVKDTDPSVHKPPVATDIPSLFWFDTTGKLVRELPFGKEFSLEIAQLDGLVVAGKPGIFYVASRSEIREYGEEGDLIRTFPIAAPKADAAITKLQFVDGRVALEFSFPAKATTKGEVATKEEKPAGHYYGPLDQSWLITNVVTGEMEALYDTPVGFTGSSLCYVGRRSFLLLTAREGQSFIVDAEP
jgi:hypothetical protein